MYPTAKIAVENAAYAYDKLYSYLIPHGFEGDVQPGCRVTVPFGGGNRRRTGIVLALDEAASRDGLKPVSALIDPEPMLDGEGLMLLRYLKEHTFCGWFDAFRLLIPAGLGMRYRTFYGSGTVPPDDRLTPKQAEIVGWVLGRGETDGDALLRRFGLEQGDDDLRELVESGVLSRRESAGRRVGDDKVVMVRLSADYRPERLTPKQKLAAEFLERNEAASIKEICYYSGVGRTVVDNMKKAGQVVYFDEMRLRSPFSREAGSLPEPPELSPAQRTAFLRLSEMAAEPKPAPALLFGVTGSGKTEVFLKLVGDVVGRGRGALVLVPEISLTAQTVESFRRRFGDTVAVLHSGLSVGERMDEWRRIRQGDASIVVGTRSAVFAPLSNIGLIVIDEEQEHTYRSEKSPRFHAREAALRRCAWHGALLLLSSATPSVETYYNAMRGRYRLVTLGERFRHAALPDVFTVDMSDSENLSDMPGFSAPLTEAIALGLERGEQSILLLNRRGYSTLVKCGECGEAAGCPQCSVAMTYHSANDSLLCHYCGYTQSKADLCAHCGSGLIRYAGTGTQKLEQELAALFPSARVLRVDADATMTKFSHEKLFSAFAAHEYDIMVGTQMVAKGLNFPDVTLVGVLSADQSLYAGDFRSYERSFSLLTQVVGRCGRGSKRGRAFVQTFSPEHPVIQLAAVQDYPAFYEQEIISRKLHLYPPFCTMAAIGFVSESLEDVQLWAGRFLDRFRVDAARYCPGAPIRLLGPVPADVLRAAGKYRYKLLLKCRDDKPTRALLAGLLEWFYGECKTVSAFIDMYCDRI